MCLGGLAGMGHHCAEHCPAVIGVAPCLLSCESSLLNAHTAPFCLLRETQCKLVASSRDICNQYSSACSLSYTLWSSLLPTHLHLHVHSSPSAGAAAWCWAVQVVNCDPMTTQEAIEAMEAVGHDFYMFRDLQSKGIQVSCSGTSILCITLC